METLLEIQNLKINFNSYLGTSEVLSSVNIELNKGVWFGLAGESGCGKSVTAYSILKLLPESADIVGGKILFEGSDLLQKTEKEMQEIRGKEIAIVFQDPQASLDPSMRIESQITEALRTHKKFRKREALEIAIDLLNKLRIPSPQSRIRQYPHELSGGMKQRVCIATALLLDPKLLIADEFTTNLDVTIQSEIINLVTRLKEEFNTSVLFISHNLALISECCEYVAIMYAGQIAEKGKKTNVFRNPHHPYTKSLLKAVPRVSGKISKLLSIDGFVPSSINPPKGCRFHTRCKYKIPNVCEASVPAGKNIEKDHIVLCHLYRQ